MRLDWVKKVVVFGALAGIGGGYAWGQYATATLTIMGSEQPVNGAWPSGVLSLTVNGQTETVSYGQFSTPSALASGLAAKFSSYPLTSVPNLCTQGLCAKAYGAQIIFQSEGQLSANLQSSGFTSPFTLDSSEWPPLTVGPGSGGLVPTDGLMVRLVNMASHLCLDDTGWGTNPGDSAQEWTCNSLAAQNWQLHDMGSGYFSIQNQNSQLCLDDPAGNTAAGTKLQQWTCNGLSPQNWQFVSAGNGYYTLQNQAAGLMLDNPGGSSQPGTQLQLWYADGQPPQNWAMMEAGTPAGDLSLSCTPSSVSQGATATCTVTAPTTSVGTVQFSIDEVPWTTATLANDIVAVSGALAGAAPGSHIIVATTNQAGTILSAMDTVNVVSSSAAIPTTVYSYSITNPWGASGYSPNGNILAYNDSINGTWQNITYDSLNRIVSAAQGPANSGTPTLYNCWAYDGFGNRTIQASSDQTPASGTCAPAGNSAAYSAATMSFTDGTNRIRGRGTASLSGTNAVAAPGYDSAGNITGDPVTNFGYLYDGEGRLCAAYTAGGITGYLYDADGHRVAKGILATMSCDPTLLVNGQPNFSVTTLYMLGPDGETMTEVDGGIWARTHVSAAGEEVATYDTLGIHFQIHDWLGTRRAQTNAAGNPENYCTSLPFGDGENCSNTALDAADKFFTGKERDKETDLDYFGARYYASNMGRWMSPDWSAKEEPVPYAKLDNPQSLNLYGYVLNNPLSKIDADGHDGCGSGMDSNGFGGCAAFGNHPLDKNDAKVLGGVVSLFAGPEAGAIGRSVLAWGRTALTAATSLCIAYCPTITSHLNAAAGGFNVSGSWVGESIAGRSTSAMSYEQQITGNVGQAFEVNGVRFDGVNATGLLEAKGPNYAAKLGQAWNDIAGDFLGQATRQLKAANGAPITWHFAEESAANFTRSLFHKNGIKGISVVYTPPK